MFIGGLVTQSTRIQNHAGKALAFDVSAAVTAYVLGMLMLTGVFPGAAFGAIPSSLGFIVMTASVVIGALFIMHGRVVAKTREPTRKELLNEIKKDLEGIEKRAADIEEAKKMLEQIETTLEDKTLPFHDRESLLRRKAELKKLI